jgi:predicted metal-dependent phosphoesterase TrpH
MAVRTSRADLHCRSTAAVTPEELYAREKRRGMDFVTIVDRDSIAAVKQIADRPDAFMSLELTACRRASAQVAHVTCYGISEFDHGWLQRHRHDLELCTAYLREHGIAHLVGPPPADYAYTETPPADTPWEFLRHVRRGWSEQRWLRGNTSFPIPSHPDNFRLPLAS